MSTPNVETAILTIGSHKDRSNGLCVMELTAWLAGEKHSDNPECVSPVIAAFLRRWNDDLDDATRQRLKPYAQSVIGTRVSKKVEAARAWLVTDWMVKTYTPAWLDLAGLKPQADALRALPEITRRTVREADGALRDAKTAADAAGAAARAAAGEAAVKCLAPTVTSLQASAFDLLDRLITMKDAGQ